MQWIRVSLILLVLIGGTSVGGASALQSEDDICAGTLIALITGVGLDPITSAPALACRLGESGQWFMPRIRDLSDAASVIDLDANGRGLLGEVDQFSTDQSLVRSILFLRNDGIVLTQGPGGKTNPTDVSDNDLGAGPSWLHNIRATYNDSAIKYLQGDINSEFAKYSWWYMNRRDAALWSISRNMNPMAGNAFLANWGFQQFPWPWQLADQASIAEYFGASIVELGKRTDVTRRQDSPSEVATEQTGVAVWGRIEVASYYSEGSACRSQYFYGGLPLRLYDVNGVELASTSLGRGEVTESRVSRGTQACALPFTFQNVPVESVYILASDRSNSSGWQIATLTGLAPDSNGNYQVTVTIP